MRNITGTNNRQFLQPEYLDMASDAHERGEPDWVVRELTNLGTSNFFPYVRE